MRRLCIISVIISLFLLNCGNKQERLVIYTEGGMFPQEILDGFQKETGIRVQYVPYESNESMFAKLEAANGGEFDLIIADDYMVENVVQAGLAQKLDRSKIANFGNINPVFQGQFYDPADDFTVPYLAGIVMLVYNPSQVPEPITSYKDLWHPGLANKVGLVDQFRVVNGMALKVLGESYNTNDLDVIQKAGDLLQDLAPNIRLFSNQTLDDEIIAGEIAAALMFTSQRTRAVMTKPELQWLFPNEGIGFGIMPAFIPVKAPNPDAAHAFLKYILDPQRGAAIFEYLGFYSTFSASDPYIDPELREFLTLPSDIDRNSMEMIGNVNDEARDLHNQIFTAFKQKAGR